MVRTFGPEPLIGSVLYLAYICVILLAWHRTRRCSLAVALSGILMSVGGYFIICVHIMGMGFTGVLASYLVRPAVVIEAIGWQVTATTFYYILPSR